MKKILFLGIISFLLAAIWQLPLSFAKPHAEKLIQGLKLEDVSGTVWKGEAKQFTINNNYLGKVNWQVNPLQSLTSFSLKTNFDIDGDDLNATGIGAVTLDKKLKLEETRFDIKAGYLNKLIKKAKIAGDVNGSIKYAEIYQQNVPIVDAIINWNNAAVEAPIKLEPGDYHAVITPENDDLNIKLTSSDAPIELNGDIKLNNEWVYNAAITAKALNPGVDAMLKLAGKAQADGTTLIKKDGDLKLYIGR